MKYSATTALLAALLSGCAPRAPVPDVASFKHVDHQTANTGFARHDAATFFQTVSITQASFSPDESSLLVSMDTTGIFNAYAVPIGKGEAAALTRSDTESILVEGYFPSDTRFLYRSDRGGDERDHIYVVEPGGATRDLTPGDNLKAIFIGWSGDERSFWIGTNERDPRAFDLYRYATDGYARELIFENHDAWTVSQVSPDGRYLALTQQNGNADSDIYLLDTHAGKDAQAEPALITRHEGAVWHDVMRFTPDSRKLVYTTDAHGEFQQAFTYDLDTYAHAPLFRADWDIIDVDYSRTGKYMLIAINEDARTVVRMVATATGQELALPELPPGDIAGIEFSRSETKLVLSISRDRVSPDLYVVDLATNELRRVTDTMNKAIDPDHLVDGQVVRYPSTDGLAIPAILYRPKRATAEHRAPALVWVHGGPGGQSRLGYRAVIQHLVNHGYAVLAVNNRGSSGYGKTFFHLDDQKHGQVDLDDCVAAREYLASLDWLDGERIGIIGGSYGGYMVVAALAFRPQVFDVGIDIFGVTNWVRTLESIPPWWSSFARRLYQELGDPKTDGERLRRISPLFHAANIERPLLVVQGKNDPRVLQVESDEIVSAVKLNGIPVEYLVFDDEGHGFRKKDNRIAASRAYVRFLDRYLAAGKP
jgi:dipeptidyl aminopeptidase/acylaminoacyl peptidase